MSFPTLTESRPTQADWNRIAKDVVNAHSRALQASGPTAERPTKNVYVGQTYFDTTLGKPIWFKGSGWVDAMGTGA